MPRQPFMVAEISKNWIADRETVGKPLSRQFEDVLEVNDTRGYRLQSFTLHRLVIAPDQINETIVAVFECKSLSARLRPGARGSEGERARDDAKETPMRG